ncbi:hypothetical protein [Microbacterium sp. lyk4-40-TSB-66]|uniref:hypothetical protein n=1 Tax=Microbacterium sp. lyk4-40-TSB-66 TaxID=3040294 RepID=UPI00254B2FC3|nr:hypothetical protein [Microbacterium sp. lyk4-40-TSB-66]
MRGIQVSAATLVMLVTLSSCASPGGDLDPGLSLPDAKARTMAVEKEIADTLPEDLVVSIDQNETGSFLSCTRDGGEQWAGGLTVHVRAEATAPRLLDPVEQRYSDADGVGVDRWESDGDSIVEITGAYQSSWIVRFDPGREEVHVSSFSACIRLPDDVWRGGSY